MPQPPKTSTAINHGRDLPTGAGGLKLAGMAAADEHQYVRVVCSKCRAVLHPRVEKAGRHVRCPDCYSAVLVPRPPAAEVAKARPVPLEYAVRDAPDVPQPGEDRSADFFPMLCPKCQARLHPRRKHVGKRARCPDCDTVFTIAAPPPPTAVKQAAPQRPYQVGEESERAEVEHNFLLVQSRLPPEPEPEVPRWWFVSGVLTFPWSGDAVGRWLILSLLIVPAEVVGGLIVWILGGGMSQGTHAVAMFAVPMAWLTVWSGSYAAACFLAIVQDTGSGNDIVHNWPDGDWRDRLVPFVYIGLHLVLASVAAAGLASPLYFGMGQAWLGMAMMAVVNFLFPFFLLSAMEADTPLMPYSPVMLRSLWRSAGAWLLVYVESVGVMAAAAGLLLLAFGAPWLALVALPFVVAAVVFVLARLQGRLAWRIGQAEIGQRKRRKKSAPRAAGPAGAQTNIVGSRISS
jgi:DNA-directed RNA polymerase subunit M/transcription elongation factor TFIIS